MSYNQSRPDKSDNKYRRTGRSTTGYHQQQQQPHRSSPAGDAGAGAVTEVDPSLSSNRSFKKPQRRHQTRVNPPPVSHPVPNKQNGLYVQSRSQAVASGGPANSSGGAIPKVPTSQSSTARGPGDPSKAFAFQFGSLGPDLRKIPAPPNMDKQKRAQVTAWVPKKDLRNKAADNQLMMKEGNSSSSEKTDVQVQHIPPPPSHMQKSPVSKFRMPSLQTPYQHPQVPHPVHFGGPNMHMQPPNVAPTSFQMPMALSIGNTPQIQHQVFFQGIPSHPMNYVQGHGFATPMGAQIHPQLGHVGVGASPHTPVQAMHKAERKYQVCRVADEEEAKQRKFKSILNKLTPQNFEKLLEQIKSVNIDNVVTLFGVVSQIFDKALMEPTSGEMYAYLCFHLSGALPDLNEDGEKISFKRLLLNKCQEEFEKGEVEEEEASRVAEERQTELGREEKRLKAQRRKLGNIRLIGELYKKRMLTEKIMHACIQKLLGYDQDPHEDNIEALCELMSTIGAMIDHDKAKVHVDAYFERMKMLSCKQELSSRFRFRLVNVIDLRKNKWQERMKVEETFVACRLLWILLLLACICTFLFVCVK